MKELEDKPLVSVIIPTYNRPKLVKRAVRSALKQSYKHIEVIVVDDCSKTPAKQSLKKINDDKLKVIVNKKNLGGAATRNEGLKQAKGVFIQFLDDDDTIREKKIEYQIRKYQEVSDKFGVISCDVNYNRSDNKGVKKNRKKGRIYKDLLNSYCVFATHSLLIKKTYLDKIDGFDTTFKSNQEYDLMLKLARNCYFEFVPKVLCDVYESKNQISFNFNKKLHGTKTLWKKYKNEYKKNDVYFYNYLRFTYLLMKYRIGKYLGKRIYSWMP